MRRGDASIGQGVSDVLSQPTTQESTCLRGLPGTQALGSFRRDEGRPMLCPVCPGGAQHGAAGRREAGWERAG